MPNITKELELPAPPDQVWATLTDFSAYPEWNTTHVAFPDGTPGAPTQGATFREKLTIMGMPGEVSWTVAEVTEGRHLFLDGEGPMGTHMKMAYDLEPNGAGTLCKVDSEFGGAALGPMVKALETASSKSLDESLEKLRARFA
jgi:carbon monoxide dehydrogenase subunit G